MLASCSPQPNWMPRKPKFMLNSCQEPSRGLVTRIVLEVREETAAGAKSGEDREHPKLSDGARVGKRGTRTPARACRGRSRCYDSRRAIVAWRAAHTGRGNRD